MEKCYFTESDLNFIDGIILSKAKSESKNFALCTKEYRMYKGNLFNIEHGVVYNNFEHNANPYSTLKSFKKFEASIIGFINTAKTNAAVTSGFSQAEINRMKLFENWASKIIQKAEASIAENIQAKKEDIAFSYFKDTRFINSKWYCYERTDFETPGILKSIIIFSSHNARGVFKVTLKHASEKLGELTGKAFINEADGLIIIRLKNKRGGNYTHYTCRLDMGDKSLSACLGHKTYATEEHGNVVSKTIILERIFNNGAENSEFGKYDFTSAEIPKPVGLFLTKKHLNRMSSPNEFVISSIKKLDIWLNRPSKKISNRFDAILGSYDVYYEVEDKTDLQIDTLEIKNEANGNPSVKFIHILDDHEKNIHIGEILLNFSTSRMTLFLAGPILPGEEAMLSNNANNKPLVLIINIPAPETQVIEILSGIIAGSRDHNDGIVARLTVLVKHELKSKIPAGAIVNYFKQHSSKSKVRPPSGKVMCKISDLKKNGTK